MSGLLAMGSPAHITYSLTLTILNRFWIRRKFADLKNDSQGVAELVPHISNRIYAARDLLQEAQQAPIRVSQDDGWLSSLIVLQANRPFWKGVKKDLRNTRRGFSAALFAQSKPPFPYPRRLVWLISPLVLMAFIAYVFTIINGLIGRSDELTDMASATVFIWMIPVILGWILVGTQSPAGAIKSALHDDNRSTYRALPDVVEPEKERQQGIVNRFGMGGNSRAPRWLGFSVVGDEEEEGPIYNYCRIFTWFQCAISIERGFSGMLNNLRKNDRDRRQVNGEHWGDSNRVTSNLNGPLLGTSSQVANYCNLPLDISIRTYTPWSEIPANVWFHIILAAAAALFVQWGTTGPAIFIANLGPTKGWGCLSGSLLLYGSIATIAWVCLMYSSLLSHAIMLRYDRRGQNISRSSILLAMAVSTRFIGKTLAVLNAGWLVLYNILQYSGTFNQCWCDTNALSMGSRGWAAIFPVSNDSEIFSDLVGGLTFSALVCAVAMGFFWLASRDSPDGEE